MPRDRSMHIGARIAEQRKLAHLTQRGLADRAHISHSLLTKVEIGQRPASPALIAACARALGIEASVLAGQPYADVQRTERFDAPLAAIRASMENWDLQLGTGTPPRPLDELATDVKNLGEKRRRANYLAVATDAPGLIDELVETSAENEGRQQERAHRLLAYVYRCVHDVAYGLGHVDLSRSVLFRMQYSAERSGDPYMVILTSYLRGQSCFNTGRHDVGLRLMERSLADVEEDARRGERSALCVQGNLRLRAAMLAARSHAGQEARAQWAEAWEVAGRLGDDTENYVMSFGPSNTLIHSVALEVELGEFGKAVKASRGVHLPKPFAEKFPDRVGHHYIDLARAQLETGQRQAAFASLQKARKVAPQQTRFHPSVKETVASLVRAERGSRESVTGFARWMGV